MEELRKLAETGNYLFHGSATGDLAILEPRQAMSHGKPDGEPCVAAAEPIEPATFMAVLGSRYVGGWGKGNPPKGHYGFYIRREDYERARAEDWRGYVYVLEKSGFQPFAAWEWRAFQPVQPFKFVAVGIADLPEEIELTG